MRRWKMGDNVVLVRSGTNNIPFRYKGRIGVVQGPVYQSSYKVTFGDGLIWQCLDSDIRLPNLKDYIKAVNDVEGRG